MKRQAAIYCRVSSVQQRDRHTIGSQLRILPALAMSRGFVIADNYIDNGVSGEKLSAMPELRRMLDDAEKHLFRAIFIIDIDRITRFSRESERALIVDILTENDVDIYTPDQKYTLKNRNDRLQFGIKGTIALYEKDTIRDRCRRGQAEKRAKGQWMGGTPPAGYHYDRDSRKLEIDPESARDVQRIIHLAETTPPREIARQIPGYTPRIIRRLLEPHRLKFYAGITEINGREIPAQWPAIISQNQRNRIISAKKKRNSRGDKTTQANHLLTGLGILTCGYCGKTLKSWTDRKIRKSGKIYEKTYYRCVSINDISGPCEQSKMMPAELIENKILSSIEKTLKNPKILKTAFSAANNGAECAREKILAALALKKSAEIKKTRLIDAIENGAIDIDDAGARITALNAEISEIDNQISEIESTAPTWAPEMIAALVNLDPRTADFHEARIVITTCIKSIKVFTGNLYIEFAFPVLETGGFSKRLILK